MTKNQLVPKWMAALSPFWQAVLALAVAIAFGMTMGGWLGLPSRVEATEKATVANRDSIRVVRSAQQDTDARLDRILCFLETDARGEDPLRCSR